MAETLITDIADSIVNGDDDTALDTIIQQYLDDWGLTETVAEWRVSNYADLRRWAYPSQQTYFDAVTTDNQVGIYNFTAECQAVNVRFPFAPTSPNPAFVSSTPLDGALPTGYLLHTLADGTSLVCVTGVVNPSTITLSSDPAAPGYYEDPDTYPNAGIYPAEGISWEVTGGTFYFAVDTPGWYSLSIVSEGYFSLGWLFLAQEAV